MKDERDRQRQFITTGKRTKNGKKPNYARIYDDLFHSSAFRDLTPTAKRLYIDFIIASKGDIRFAFPKTAAAAAGYSTKRFFEAAKDLESHGFITVDRFKNSKNVYNLSGGWMQWKNGNE